MSDASWKREERTIAEIFGGKRIPVLGDSGMDIDAPGYAVSVKKRKSLPQWLHDSVTQIQDASRDDQMPVVVLSECKQGVRAKRYVVLALDDLREWWL